MEKAQQYAEGVINDPVVEFAWAEVAAKHAETHFKLLTSFADSTKLNLTKLDDEIYKHFRQLFPDLRIDVLDYDAMKTDAAKSIWRDLFKPYEQRVHQFNFATLLRVNCADEEGYWEKNTIIVPRIQFLAVEIARNREGHNKKLYDALQSKKN